MQWELRGKIKCLKVGIQLNQRRYFIVQEAPWLYLPFRRRSKLVFWKYSLFGSLKHSALISRSIRLANIVDVLRQLPQNVKMIRCYYLFSVLHELLPFGAGYNNQLSLPQYTYPISKKKLSELFLTFLTYARQLSLLNHVRAHILCNLTLSIIYKQAQLELTECGINVVHSRSYS